MEKLTCVVRKYHVERLVWCLATAMFCWTDIADYEQIIYNKKLCVWVVLGLFYVYKQGCLKKENRKLTAVCFGIGVCLTIFFVCTNFFSFYYYYNFTIGLLSPVLLLQYALLLQDILKTRRKPHISIPAVCMLGMIVFTQFSPHTDKARWPLLLAILLPYALMDVTKERMEDVFKGMVDGLCVGFIICQSYTFLFRPYVLTENGYRFKAFRDYCTFAGLSYMQFYIGYLLKYVILEEEHASRWKRWSMLLMSAFVLSLLYLTGGRSPVIGVVFITAILIGWSYRSFSIKKAFICWGIKCVGLALASVLLFPVAYAGTRYLPTVLNHPDLQDSEGNRLYSFSTLVLKQRFLYNHEWSERSVKANAPRDSYKYITFEESAEETLARVIPGLNRILTPVLADTNLHTRIMRSIGLYEEGYYSQDQVYTIILNECEYYDKEIPDYAQHFIDTLDDPQILEPDESEYISDQSNAGTGRGDRPEYGWFGAEEDYTSMELRIAIHMYAIGKLNLFGHARHSFKMYYRTGSEMYLGHAHNIFLLIGYDYGVFAMLFMILSFALLAVKGWKLARTERNAFFLLPLALIIGMTAFGWFEAGFGLGNSYSELIFLCTMLLRSTRREKDENGKSMAD